MEGQIKITVIATGFDAPPATAAETPVDLEHYVRWQEEEPVAVAAGEAPRPGAVELSRRLPLDLPAPEPGPSADEGHAGDLAVEEEEEAMEMPAFLR